MSKISNSLIEHQPLTQEEFRGLYSRGVTDSGPDDYFLDTLNVRYSEGEVFTRHGSVQYISKANIVRYFTYRRLNETPRLIMLDSSGNLLDSLAPGTPIYTDATFTDFSMVNYNNRAYITAHNRIRGIPSKKLLVYEGSGSARLAAGSPPSGFTLSVATSATAGSIESGIHLFAVCYITSSGFITAPGPEAFPQLAAPGGFKANLTGIAAGPTGTVARIIVATRSIPSDQFTGNPYGYEFFFVPNGTISDNTTTTLTVDFFDSDLLNSADYLIDNLSSIPAGLGLCIYNGRLVTWAENGNEFTLRVSEFGQPEVFNEITGFINLDPSDAGSGVKNCFEHRKNLVVCTSNRIYATADNGDDPSTWAAPTLIDNSIGTECFGIATQLDARSTNNDRAWIASRAGLMCFEGFIKKPELSWNIEGTWARINKAVFNLVQVVDDPVGHHLYVSVPLDSATAISHILYADYSKAFTVYGTIDETALKWAIWSFPNAPISITGELDDTTKQPVFRFSNSLGAYDLKSGLFDDYGNAIDSYIESALKDVLPGWIHHYAGIKVRCRGVGSLIITVRGEDSVLTLTPPAITMSLTPGGDIERAFNFINEKCAVKLRVVNFGERFAISRFDMYCKPLWFRRPQ
jgi:hypothetical protein